MCAALAVSVNKTSSNQKSQDQRSSLLHSLYQSTLSKIRGSLVNANLMLAAGDKLRTK